MEFNKKTKWFLVCMLLIVLDLEAEVFWRQVAMGIHEKADILVVSCIQVETDTMQSCQNRNGDTLQNSLKKYSLKKWTCRCNVSEILSRSSSIKQGDTIEFSRIQSRVRRTESKQYVVGNKFIIICSTQVNGMFDKFYQCKTIYEPAGIKMQGVTDSLDEEYYIRQTKDLIDKLNANKYLTEFLMSDMVEICSLRVINKRGIYQLFPKKKMFAYRIDWEKNLPVIYKSDSPLDPLSKEYIAFISVSPESRVVTIGGRYGHVFSLIPYTAKRQQIISNVIQSNLTWKITLESARSEMN